MNIPFRVDLSGKVAAVTGGAGVMMSDFCRALAECGAKVAVINRTKATAEALATEIGENAIGISADCTKKEDIFAAKKIINEKWGKVNFLSTARAEITPRLRRITKR